jgi:hypothetical protein
MQLQASLYGGNAESMCMLQCHCTVVSQYDLQHLLLPGTTEVILSGAKALQH